MTTSNVQHFKNIPKKSFNEYISEVIQVKFISVSRDKEKRDTSDETLVKSERNEITTTEDELEV